MQYNRILNAINLFEELFKSTNKIIFAFDIDSKKFLFLNPAFEKIWNVSIQTITEQPSRLLDTLHPEDKEHLLQAYKDMLDGIEKKEIEFRIQLPDKSIRWVVVNSHFIREKNNKKGVVGFVDDISKLKENEMVLQKFAAKKDSVLEILSHDLAGPLNNIKGISALLAGKLEAENQPELTKLVSMIEKTSERSIRLIRESVKIEFLQSKEAELVKKRVNIVKEVAEIIDQYKKSENEISKKFHFQISNKSIFVDIDAYKFSQVINNLISNAIKFTKDDGIIILGLQDTQKNVLITVADNGVGIPTKYHENIFDKFNKARRPGLKGEPSVGLGMSIIKTIVDWHGGRIWFESKEGKGSTFYIELPKN